MEDPDKILKPIKKNPAAGMSVLIVILALVIFVLAIWVIISIDETHKQKIQKEAQRTEFQAKLDSLMVIHNKIKTEYGELSDSLAVKDSVIQARALEIKKLMNTQWEYYKIKKKFARLKKIAQGYVSQMDSLYNENHALIKENHQIITVLQEEKKKNVQLMSEKKGLTGKVKQACILNTYGYQIEAVHVTGTGHERKTDKVKRVNKIKVYFTIAKNIVAKPGARTIYLRIAQPDRKILTIGGFNKYSFMFNGKILQYTEKKEIKYRNHSMDICMSWVRPRTKDLRPGLYHVDIFEGNNTIGQASLTLR